MEKIIDIQKIKNDKDDKYNGVIFVDYENLKNRLEEYKVDPIYKVNIFEGLLEILNKQNINIVDAKAYANFYKIQEQTDIQNYCFETKHTNIDTKNSSDIEMSVDILNTLYNRDNIDVFIIVASDRDYVPVLKTIKQRNKISYLISTKNGFNKIVKRFCDHHCFIEDMFKFDERGYKIGENNIKDILIEPQEISDYEDNSAKEICEKLKTSFLWTNYIEKDTKISLDGYIKMALKLDEYKENDYSTIEKYFKIANARKYINLYEENNIIYIKE